MITTFLPSGATFEVLTQDEADLVETWTLAYLANFTFEIQADINDLDAVVTGELLCWRWQNWMSREEDWNNDAIDVRHYSEAWKKTSTEVRQLKSQIGIDKNTRDRTTGDGSVPEFIGRILTAAKLMGVHRNEQQDLVLELAMHLRTLCTVYRNSDDEERRLTRCTAEDIIEWILEVFDPTMEMHDLLFQQSEGVQDFTGKL